MGTINRQVAISSLYRDVCEDRTKCEPYPVTADKATAFLATLWSDIDDQGEARAPEYYSKVLSTLKGAAIADQQWQLTDGQELMVRQATKTLSTATRVTEHKQAEPMTLELVRSMTRAAAKKQIAAQMVDCMVVVALWALLRAGELVALKCGDLCFNRMGECELKLQHTKTERDVKLTLTPVVGQYQEVCPVGHLRRWYEQLRKDRLRWDGRDVRAADPVFPALTPSTSELELDKHMTTAQFTSRLRLRLEDMGMGRLETEQFTGHSMRRGGATALAAAGLGREVIKRRGRWLSDAVDLYIDMAEQEVARQAATAMSSSEVAASGPATRATKRTRVEGPEDESKTGERGAVEPVSSHGQTMTAGTSTELHRPVQSMAVGTEVAPSESEVEVSATVEEEGGSSSDSEREYNLLSQQAHRPSAQAQRRSARSAADPLKRLEYHMMQKGERISTENYFWKSRK